MDFEDILLDVGDYGRYQKALIMVFLVPAASLLPWFTMNVLFMVSTPDHWCRVPYVSDSNLSMAQQRALISPPKEHCHRFDINFTLIDDLANFTVPVNSTTRPCDQGWDFDNTYYDYTVATQWNMFCDDAHYTSFVLSLYNVGSIIGTPIYGKLSDKIGRKITFFITIVITATSAFASVFMTNFTAFIVIKTINGFLMPSVFQLPYIIVLELVSPEMRTRMNGVVNMSWTFGLCFLPLVAYYSRNWFTLGLITSAVTLVYFCYYKFLPESPRWLVSQERYDEAADIMYKIGKVNGKVNEKSSILNKLQKLGEREKKEKEENGVNNSSFDLLKYPQLRKKFLIITFCWTANIMSYYGLQFNVSNLAGNEFVNFFLLSLVEIPGYLSSWIFMEKYGRRWCTVVGFLLTGFMCFLPVFDFPYVDVICSMFGKYLSAGTFMATYQQSSELYPTVVRSLGMGLSSTVAMTATLIVPYLVYLAIYGKAIPFIIIGMFGIVAGVLASFLPETLNEHLPQTISDAEKFGRNQKFFSCNKRRQSLSRERAASIATTLKGLDILSLGNLDGQKSNRSSQVLQNVEFSSGQDQRSGSVTYQNGKRSSTDTTHQGEDNNSRTVRSDSKASGQQQFGSSTTEESADKESPIQGSVKTDEFSYVNTVFDNDDVIAPSSGKVEDANAVQ